MGKGFKLKTIHLVAIGLLIIIASYMGYINITLPGQTQPTPTPGPGPTPVPPLPPGVTYDAAALKFALQNAITDGSISGGNEGLDVSLVSNGIWDPMSKVETVADWSAATATSALTYNYGDTLVLHAYSDNDETGGTDCYDSWYYVTLIVGEPVRKLSSSVITASQSSPTYKYQISGVGADTGYDVQYVAGTTPYWGLGALKVVPRTTAANLDTYLTYGGTTLASVTTGSDWDDADDGSEQDNSVNLATDDEDMYVKLVAGATNIGYGTPMYTIASNGRFEARQAVVIITSNATSLGVAQLTDDGWTKLSDSTLTSEVGFWKAVPEQLPAKGQKFSVDIKIPVDASALSGSTVYGFKVWVIDFQLPSNVAVGATSTSIPTAYGMVAAYGIDAMIFAKAYSTSSGAGTGEIIDAGFYTAA